MIKTLLFIVNDPGFFLSHRLAVAKGAHAAGYKVHVACMPGAAVAAITAQGFERSSADYAYPTPGDKKH